VSTPPLIRSPDYPNALAADLAGRVALSRDLLDYKDTTSFTLNQ
jgi:hypothetical protein